jgi:hypothetical protein
LADSVAITKSQAVVISTPAADGEALDRRDRDLL